MQTKLINRKIYAQFLTHCPPGVLPEPWATLPPPANLFLHPPNTAAVLAALARQFSPEQLCASHLAVAGTNGVILPTSLLADPERRLLALYDDSSEGPFDLFLGQSGLSASPWPLGSFLADLS